MKSRYVRIRRKNLFSPAGLWTLLKFMFEHEYYTDIAVLHLCIVTAGDVLQTTENVKLFEQPESEG